MKPTKKLFVTALAFAALSAGVWAEDPASGAPAAKDAAAVPAAAAPAPVPSVVTAADVQALKDALASQQLQLQRLEQQLQRQLETQQAGAEAATSKADTRPAPQQQAAAITSGTPIQQDNSAPSGLNLQNQASTDNPDTNPMHGGTSIHFKGITITPGGFVAAEFVRRSRALGADVTTPFNSLTLPGASQNTLSEFFGSARQTRPTVYIDGRLKNVEPSSYVSADSLSSGDPSSATSTNSYTLRLRQAWGQAKFDNGWSFLGGQMWSLVTEGKAGIAPSDDLGKVNDARPMTIDPGYNVGFSFARQDGLRLTKDFSDKVSVAFAVENAQGTLTTHGNAANFLLGEAGASNSYNTTANYTANPSPDLIAKIAFDPGFGHYEIYGLVDRFADRVFPCYDFDSPGCPCGLIAPSVIGAYNVSKEGGGVGANARWTVANKHIVFGLHAFGGSGVGRYGAAQLSDLSINGDGTVHLIKESQGLGTLEWHGKKLDIYGYVGGEYADRTYSKDPYFVSQNATTGLWSVSATPVTVGYGAPNFNNTGCYTETVPTSNSGFAPGALGKCTGCTRAIAVGATGFWYTCYNGPHVRFRFGTQSSYVTRDPWSGTGGAPHGLDSMVFTSFRYYLP